MLDIKYILSSIAEQRRIFHSEADFQHTFAWEIHQRFPQALVRLERPLAQVDNRIYLDVWVKHDDKVFAFELKYKTRSLSIEIDDELFSLRNQYAQDCGRYDFIKDIQRLEYLTGKQANIVGYAILLTNDRAYWSQVRNNTVDAELRLQEGRLLRDKLSWKAGASAGTMASREEPLNLRHAYLVKWNDYSQLSAGGNHRFRYLAVKVEN